jgi:hypothetical protein
MWTSQEPIKLFSDKQKYRTFPGKKEEHKIVLWYQLVDKDSQLLHKHIIFPTMLSFHSNSSKWFKISLSTWSVHGLKTLNQSEPKSHQQISNPLEAPYDSIVHEPLLSWNRLMRSNFTKRIFQIIWYILCSICSHLHNVNVIWCN